MEVLLFIKKLFKDIINHNNIIGLLRDANRANIMYIILILIGFSLNKWFPHMFDMSDSILHLNEEESIKMLQLLMLLGFYIVPIYSIVFSKDLPRNILKYAAIENLSNFSNYLEYYSDVVPIFLISTGIVFITLRNFNEIFILLGIVILALALFVYFIFVILNAVFSKRYNAYYNLTRANDIFINYVILDGAREKNLAIKEFTKSFVRVLDSIDLYLDKGIKIDYLKNEENFPVKQVIIHYLPIYLKYSDEVEKKSFQIKLNSLVSLIDSKNFKFSLYIVKVIYSIYQDITRFLDQQNFTIPKDIRLFNFEYNSKMIFEEFKTYILVIFIFIGLIKDIIPYDLIKNPIAKLALILSPLSPILFQIFLRYYQWFKK